MWDEDSEFFINARPAMEHIAHLAFLAASPPNSSRESCPGDEEPPILPFLRTPGNSPGKEKPEAISAIER